MPKDPPILVEPSWLDERLTEPNIQVIDLSDSQRSRMEWIPGAINLQYSDIVNGGLPATGQVPSEDKLQLLRSKIGLRKDLHIIAYDDEGSGRASRLVWTLYLLGHRRASVLNGGIHSWVDDGRLVTRDRSNPTASDQALFTLDESVLATRNYVFTRLNSSDHIFLDVRTKEEYCGSRTLASRGGHIPGAVNLDWLDTIDATRQLRLKSKSDLSKKLQQLGISPDREIIVYCQTHHRSAHSWMMLKHLGYPRVRGYAGSWSEWGNNESMPIE